MKQQEERKFLNSQISQRHEASPLNSSETHLHPHEPSSTIQASTKFPRHYYIEQQNTKNRFIPALLLCDRLHSKLDSSGNTILAHMCSMNSEYLPLYINHLPQGDMEFTYKNSYGHTALDVATLYCNKDIIDLLVKKGAVPGQGTDYWAIRGGNPGNWSGQVPLDMPELIHWAAYNDMVQVLKQYNRSGVSLGQTDLRGATPIEVAVSNKSYTTFKYLLELGYRPNKQKLKDVDSRSMSYLYAKSTFQQLTVWPTLLFIVLLLCHYWLSEGIQDLFLSFQSLALFLILLCLGNPQPREHDGRVFHFYSKVLNRRIQWGNNHIAYLLFSLCSLVSSVYILVACEIGSYLAAFCFWYVAAGAFYFLANLTTQLYGINNNLTQSEMMERHKHKHLYKKVRVIEEKKMLYHQFHNPFDKGALHNWRYYFALY